MLQSTPSQNPAIALCRLRNKGPQQSLRRQHPRLKKKHERIPLTRTRPRSLNSVTPQKAGRDECPSSHHRIQVNMSGFSLCQRHAQRLAAPGPQGRGRGGACPATTSARVERNALAQPRPRAIPAQRNAAPAISASPGPAMAEPLRSAAKLVHAQHDQPARPTRAQASTTASTCSPRKPCAQDKCVLRPDGKDQTQPDAPSPSERPKARFIRALPGV